MVTAKLFSAAIFQKGTRLPNHFLVIFGSGHQDQHAKPGFGFCHYKTQ